MLAEASVAAFAADSRNADSVVVVVKEWAAVAADEAVAVQVEVGAWAEVAAWSQKDFVASVPEVVEMRVAWTVSCCPASSPALC